MRQAFDQFLSALAHARNLGTIAQYISNVSGTAAPDVSDIYRAQVVALISAFDTLVHNLTRVGMLDALRHVRTHTTHSLNFKVRLTTVLIAIDENTTVAISNERNGTNNLPSNNWFANEIREQHSYSSFQKHDKVAEAIRLFHPNPLWQEVSLRMGLPEKDVKKRLDLIVTRRNQIAHESDIDPANVGERIAISFTDVASNIDFIEQLGRHIFDIVR